MIIYSYILIQCIIHIDDAKTIKLKIVNFNHNILSYELYTDSNISDAKLMNFISFLFKMNISYLFCIL